MSSHIAAAARRVPQQERGHRRVASLLGAAAEVMAEAGYELTTMCAIAERAGSSVGSLYQFFPNKEALAEALRAGYIGEVEALWSTLARRAKELTAEELAAEVVKAEVDFAQRHRAFLALLDAPVTANSWNRRERIASSIAQVLMASNPQMSREDARQAGAVVHQIVKGMLTLYARAGARKKAAVAREFGAVLLGYLKPKLGAKR